MDPQTDSGRGTDFVVVCSRVFWASTLCTSLRCHPKAPVIPLGFYTTDEMEQSCERAELQGMNPVCIGTKIDKLVKERRDLGNILDGCKQEETVCATASVSDSQWITWKPLR